MVGQHTPQIGRRALLLSALLPRLAAQPSTPSSELEARNYTATAVVGFLGITLVTRHGAAGGFARAVEHDGETVIEFGAGSLPERCAGVNRMGYIRETVAGVAPRRRTFGFMTVSREESLQQARNALHRSGSEQPFIILDSTADSNGCESRVASVNCASSLRWPEWQAVESEIMKRWPAAEKRISRTQGFMPGFLSAVRAAMMRGGKGSLAYIHNDKRYNLDWSTAGGSSTTAELQGRISGQGKARFKVWFDPSRPGAPPLAFEYQPRSFLRVRFDAVTGEQS